MYAREITEEKEQQQELQRLERQLQTVLGTMSAAVFLKDADGRYQLMNQACQELLDVGDQDITGLTDEDLFSPAVAEKARKDDQQVLENGGMVEIEEKTPTATGDTTRLTRKSPVYNDDGEVAGICGVSTDITQQKERENELKYYERINTFGDIATIIDSAGKITGDVWVEDNDPEGSVFVIELRRAE